MKIKVILFIIIISCARSFKNIYAQDEDLAKQIAGVESEKNKNGNMLKVADSIYKDILIQINRIRFEEYGKYNAAAVKFNSDCAGKSWEGTDCQSRKDKLLKWRNELVSQFKKLIDDSVSYKKSDDDLWGISIEIDKKLYSLKEEQKMDNDFDSWLSDEQITVRNAVQNSTYWTEELLSAFKGSTNVAESCQITSISRLIPGDILLVAPTQLSLTNLTSLKDNILYIGDRIYRRKTIELENSNKACHTITYIGKGAHGEAFFLNNTRGVGSHILTQSEFKKEYGDYSIFVARPRDSVDGRKLFDAALDAVKNSRETKTIFGSDYGVFGKDMVCSEKSAYIVFLAKGIPNYDKKDFKLTVDVTPNDFYDKEKEGKYFCLSTLPLNTK